MTSLVLGLTNQKTQYKWHLSYRGGGVTYALYTTHNISSGDSLRKGFSAQSGPIIQGCAIKNTHI